MSKEASSSAEGRAKEASSSAEGRAFDSDSDDNPRKRLFSPEEEINVKKMKTSTPNKKASSSAEGGADELLKRLYNELRRSVEEMRNLSMEEMPNLPMWERVRQLQELGFKRLEELGFKRLEIEALMQLQPEDVRQNIREWETESFEFADDPLNYELYQKALSHGVEKDRTLRVNVVGNFNQGKTSLTKVLLGQKLKSPESTNSVEINHCKYSNINDTVHFSLKSTPSSDTEYIRRMTSFFYKETNSDKKDGTKTGQKTNDPKSESLNKERNHSSTEAKTEANRKPMYSNDFREISSHLITKSFEIIENDEELQIWDFGGQFIFYATHTLFHSKRSIYLLVFDLTKQLSDVIEDPEFPEECVGKTMQKYTEYWMNSIHSYVGNEDGSEPQVILVGTHKDKLAGDDKMKEKFIDNYFDKIRKMFEETPIINHIQTTDFAIDCTDPNDSGVAELRKEIVRLGSSKKEQEVPARWIPLEKALFDKKHRKVVPVNEVEAIDARNEIPLKEKEDIKLFLLYHHAKGNLFYFDEDPISRFVVLDTQYLIDAFKCIITSERFCKKDPEYRPLWRCLRQEARLEMKLIKKVWNEDSGFFEHTNELLMFMQRHYMISEAKEYDEETEQSKGLGWFLVPCFLRDHSSNDTLKEFLKGRQETRLRFVLSFNISTVVQIVYYRLIAALIGKWPVVPFTDANQDRKNLLYENIGAFRLDRHHVGIVELDQQMIDLSVLSVCQSSRIQGSVVDMFRRFVVSNVLSEFKKLRHAVTRQKQLFEICFKCNHESHCIGGSSQTVSLEQLKAEKVEPCPDLVSGHEIFTQDALSEWFQYDLNIELKKDCPLEERQISKISQTIGENWELLGSKLGLKDVQLQQISLDFEGTVMRIFKMLLKWVAQKMEDATVNTLIRAMKSTKSLSVDWDEVRNILEEIADTQ